MRTRPSNLVTGRRAHPTDTCSVALRPLAGAEWEPQSLYEAAVRAIDDDDNRTNNGQGRLRCRAVRWDLRAHPAPTAACRFFAANVVDLRFDVAAADGGRDGRLHVRVWCARGVVHVNGGADLEAVLDAALRHHPLFAFLSAAAGVVELRPRLCAAHFRLDCPVGDLARFRDAVNRGVAEHGFLAQPGAVNHGKGLLVKRRCPDHELRCRVWSRANGWTPAAAAAAADPSRTEAFRVYVQGTVLHSGVDAASMAVTRERFCAVARAVSQQPTLSRWFAPRPAQSDDKKETKPFDAAP